MPDGEGLRELEPDIRNSREEGPGDSYLSCGCKRDRLAPGEGMPRGQMVCEVGAGRRGEGDSGRFLRIQVLGQVGIIQDTVHTELYTVYLKLHGPQLF